MGSAQLRSVKITQIRPADRVLFDPWTDKRSVCAPPQVQIGSPITPSNQWRRRYPRPETVQSIGLDAVRLLAEAKKTGKHAKAARELQRELLRTTGYAGGNAELGHRVSYELRVLGYSETVAQFAGHLCAIAGSWNFQGNWRISKLMRRSLRTIQRCRALLEADGLISSCLLLPGDMVDGQNSPVTRPHIVRDVSPLQRLANNRTAQRQQPHKRSKRSTAETPPPAPRQTVSAAQLEQVAANAPDWLAPIIGAAAASKRQAEAGGPRSAAEVVASVPDLTSHRGRISAAELDQHLERTARRRPIWEQPAPAPPSDPELDELDAELARLSEQQRPADKPPPER